MFCLVFVPANGTLTIVKDNVEVIVPNYQNTLTYFYILKSLSEVGVCLINLQIWGMIADCIDDVQVKTGVREDGTSYAIFMFFRKFGQVIAAISINASLIAMGYDFANADIFTEEQTRLMFYLGTLIPVVMIGIAAFLMLFRYPLNKARLEQLQDEKEALFAREAAEENKQDATKEPVKQIVTKKIEAKQKLIKEDKVVTTKKTKPKVIATKKTKSKGGR